MAEAGDEVCTEQSSNMPMFRELNADDPDPEITEIESLCLQCGENGITKLLLTKIPFYKEVVLMSFSCGHCNWENNELQPAATIQEKGVRFNLKVSSNEDIARQVVKTKSASIVIPELSFEIPAHTQEGTVTTVEGVLQRAYDGIKSKQEMLQTEDPEASAKLKEFLEKLLCFKEGKSSFHFILSDCSGNSFLENRYAPKPDPEMQVQYFERSHEENLMLGTVPPTNGMCDADETSSTEDLSKQSEEEKLKNEVLEFPTNCSCCNTPCITKMKVTNVPHFKDVVIMATTCDACGYNTNEVKSGGGIGPNGVRFTLQILGTRDLSRDLLKSDTCKVEIPELELEVGPAALTGRYTTVEGLITGIKTDLTQLNPLAMGDSARPEVKKGMQLFVQKLDEVLHGKRPCTLILDDPCGNSYLQSIHYPNPDENLSAEKYRRSFEQDEELGLNDMKVENYES